MPSFQDMLNAGEVESSKSVNFFVWASVAWAVWKARNDWVFNNRLIKSPKALAYKVLALLKQWKKILKTKDQEVMEDTLLKLQEGLRAWWSKATEVHEDPLLVGVAGPYQFLLQFSSFLCLLRVI